MSEEKNSLDVLRDIIKSIVIAGKGNVINIGSTPIPVWFFSFFVIVILAISLVWYFRVYQPQQKAIHLHLENGNKFFNIGQPADAENEYREAQNLDPQNFEVRRSLKKVGVYLQIENGDRSATIRTNMENLDKQSPNDPQVHLLSGHFHARTDAVKAEEHYLKAISLDSSMAEAYFGLGVLYDKQRQPDKALEMFGKAAQISESERYLSNLAYLHYQKGNYDEAIENYEKVRIKDADYLLTYSELASAYRDKGDFGNAEKLLKEVLPMFENQAIIEASRNKSAWYYSDPIQIISVSDIADKKFYVLCNLSLVLWLDGKESEAESFIRQAQDIAIKDKEAVRALIFSHLSELEKKHPESKDRINGFRMLLSKMKDSKS